MSASYGQCIREVSMGVLVMHGSEAKPGVVCMKFPIFGF